MTVRESAQKLWRLLGESEGTTIIIGIKSGPLSALVTAIEEYEHPKDHVIEGQRPRKPGGNEPSHDYRYGMASYIKRNTGISIAVGSSTPLTLLEAIADRYGL
tara:strand:- start:1039 stop:1347 length:309 start_codon:yes stop_codon:yes gene_type:complete